MSERERVPTVPSARKIELNRLLMQMRDLLEAVAWISAHTDESFKEEVESALLDEEATTECLRRWGVIK